MNSRRKLRLAKYILSFGVIGMFFQIMWPASAYALTEGPAQPEQETHSPIQATDMVDLFTGDFSYNLPLFEVPGPGGGFPINLNYNASPTTDTEASMIGLGWNLNLGNISRSMRGLPDDFKGDLIEEESYIKPDKTVGFAIDGGRTEFFGLPISVGGGGGPFSINWSFGGYKSSYFGYGINTSIMPSLSFSRGMMGGNVGVGLSFDSQTGVGLNPTASLGVSMANNKASYGASLNVGASFNSKQGLGSMSLGVSANVTKNVMYDSKHVTAHIDDVKGGMSASYMLYSRTPFSSPVQTKMSTRNDGIGLYLPTVPAPFAFSGLNAGVISIGGFNGYKNVTKVAMEKESVPAYGYNYSHESPKGVGLMDFDRFDDRPINRFSRKIAVPSFNHDYLQIRSHLTSGLARAFRSKHGVLFDRESTSELDGVQVNGEFGITGPLIHVGVDVLNSWGGTTTGPWDTDRDNFSPNHEFDGQSANGDIDFEPIYYKMQGELTVEEFDNDNLLFDDGTPQRVKLNKHWQLLNFQRIYNAEDEMGYSTLFNNNFFKERKSRKKRNNMISSLTRAEVEKVGVSRYLYDPSYSGTHTFQARQQDHHIAEYTVLDPGGAKAIFGYPVYNGLHRSVTGAYPSPANPFDQGGISDYGPDYFTGNDYASMASVGLMKQNTVAENLTDQFFHATAIENYAHDYLLNAILGADYVDVDGVEGPSEGDFGFWVKIDYETMVQDYKWRAPYDRANYMPGKRNETQGELQDDRFSYIYGEKDLVYPTRVETKTHFVTFTYTNRQDALEAHSELALQGQKGSRSMKRLTKVSLFSKKDPTQPLIETHFDNDHYDLCQNTRNSNAPGQGKLTLKKLWFEYQGSPKGQLSPYTFVYDQAKNFDYAETSYDNWSNYKHDFDPSGPYYADVAGTGTPHEFNNNVDFPYVDQTRPKADHDNFVAAWTLSEIHLPSGARIEVEFEADDHHYVQDKRAHEMLQIVGFGTSPDDDIEHTQVGNSNGGLAAGEDRMHVRLPVPVSNAAEFKKQYLDGVEEKVYYKAYMLLTSNDGSQFPTSYQGGDVYDYVHGYMEIDPSTYGVNAAGDIGWVRVRPETVSENNSQPISPLTKAGLQYVRINRPNMSHQPATTFGQAISPGTIFNMMAYFAQEFANIFTNYNRQGVNRGGCQTLNTDKSFVRLAAPVRTDGTGNFVSSKIGGGSRVKSLQIAFDWENAGTETIERGQTYSYTTQLEDGTTISSGVAEFTPSIGIEENPMKSFKEDFSEVNKAMVDNNLFVENPVMVGFYPAAKVGYSKVTITPFGKSNGMEGSDKSKVGREVFEYYTCKDFPLREAMTILDPHPPSKTPIVLPLFGQRSRAELSVSQGFAVELNNMHGQMKRQSSYAQSATTEGDFVTRTTYKYKTEEGKLDNEVEVLTAHGEKDRALVGVDRDMYTSMRQTTSDINKGGIFPARANLDMILPFVYIPTFWPIHDRNLTTLRTVANVKITQRYGILEEVEAEYMGSKAITKNILYDAETGQPLLTSTTNEFDAPVYSYQYASHWNEEGMEPAYQNWGYEREDVVVSSSAGANMWKFHLDPGEEEIFTPGDEILAEPNSGSSWTVLTVKELDLVNSFAICYGDANSGSGTYDLMVYRSGHRNQQSVGTGTILFLNENQMTQPAGGSVAQAMATILNAIVANNPCSGAVLKANAFTYPSLANEFAVLNAAGYYGDVALHVGGYFYVGFYNSSKPPQGWNDSCIAFYHPVPVSCTYWNTINFSATPAGLQIEVMTHTGLYNNIVADNGGSACYMDTLPNVYEGVLHADASTFSDDWDYDFEDANQQDLAQAKANASSQGYNPYATGEKGIWRMHEQFSYKEDRAQVDPDVTVDKSPDLANQGVYQQFVEYDWNGSLYPSWIYSTTVSKMSPYGYDIENTNALNIPSSALYGYESVLPIMKGANAEYYELANANFEDVIGYTQNNGGVQNQFGHFHIVDLNQVVNEDAHTGKHSLKVPMTVSASTLFLRTIHQNKTLTKLKGGEDYLVSLWVKPDVFSIDNLTLKVSPNLGSSGTCSVPIPTDMTISETPIEGWHKAEVKLSLPAGGCEWGLELVAELGGFVPGNMFIDDVRVQPFDSEATAFVYAGDDYRYRAMLDGNNYATFYSYDEEGKLTHVRRETERGVSLIKEYSNHIKIQP